MPGRTLDQIIQESLGLKEMTISRLLWHVEDLKAQLAELQQQVNRAQKEESHGE